MLNTSDKDALRTDLSLFLALFAGLTDTWWPAISSPFNYNFFFIRQKNNKKSKKVTYDSMPELPALNMLLGPYKTPRPTNEYHKVAH